MCIDDLIYIYELVKEKERVTEAMASSARKIWAKSDDEGLARTEKDRELYETLRDEHSKAYSVLQAIRCKDWN